MRGRGLVIGGGMVIGLLLGCNNGGEDPQKVFLKSVVSLGNEFLDVFTSFSDMFSGTLGFKADTSKKEEVGKYFKGVQEAVQSTKNKLEKIVDSMKTENNPNASKTEAAVTDLNKKLTQIIEGASEVIKGTGGSELIGNVAPGGSGSDAKGVAGTGVEDLVKGIGKIVNVVLGQEGSATAGDDDGPVQDSGGTAGAKRSSSGGTHGDARYLFANDQAGAAVTNTAQAAKDAYKSVSAVTGADILKAMAEDSGKAATLAKSDTGHSSIGNVSANAKDAEVAGGIALRAMAKGGKFAGPTGGAKKDVATAVKGAAVSAVTKALDTLTIAIRKTIDEGLKGVKEAMNINANDNPLTSETATAAK